MPTRTPSTPSSTSRPTGGRAAFRDGSDRLGLGDVGRIVGRGSAAADFDNDGDLDVAVNNIGGPLVLLENTGAAGHWLEIALDSFAPGAMVTVELSDGRRLVRELQAGGSYLSSEDPRAHFGLGSAGRGGRGDGPVAGRGDHPDDRRGRRSPPRGGATPSLRRVGMRARMVRSIGTLLLLLVLLPACSQSDSSSSDYMVDGCTPEAMSGWSAARVWDEAMLDAIRRDLPAPTVHARNLFHVSAAMWDAWAAYDPVADGYFVDEKLDAGTPDRTEAARRAAISYAAYRILLHRYSQATGLEATFDELASTMTSLCYRIDFVGTAGDSPAALGNRIAATVIETGRDDGSLEAQRYVDTDYRPVNAPMVVARPGTTMRDPNRWQPLALSQLVSQNGVPMPGSVQRFVGPHWGSVPAFALPEAPTGVPIDPGPPPLLGDPSSDDAFKQAAVDVIEASSVLGPEDGVTVDISPGSDRRQPVGHQRRRRARPQPGDG